MLKPKIDQTVDKIVLHMNDDTIVGLARSIEKSYGPDTGQGVLHATSPTDYARQFVWAYMYDQIASVYGLVDEDVTV